MENIERLITTMSNILDAVKEGQVATKEAEQQVAELKELKNDKPAYVYVVKTISEDSCLLRIAAKNRDEAYQWSLKHAKECIKRRSNNSLKLGVNTITWLDGNLNNILTWRIEKVELIKSSK